MELNNQNKNQNEEVAAETESEIKLENKEKKFLLAGIIFIFLALVVLTFIFLIRNGFFVSSKPISETNIAVDNNVNNNVDNNVDQATSSQDKTASVGVVNGVNSTPIIPTQRIVEVPVRSVLPVPEQSKPTAEASIPANAIKIIGTPNGFEPNEFTVSRGQDITLALTARTERPVILTFYDPNMAAVSIGCGSGETRWVSFKAPSQAGEYIYRNNTMGLSNQTGKMIVK